MINNKIISLAVIQPNTLGLRAGRINHADFDKIHQKLIALGIHERYSEILANTLLRVKSGSIDLLVKWSILSEEEANILKQESSKDKTTNIIEMIQQTTHSGFSYEIKKLLSKYQSSPKINIDKLHPTKQTHLLSRLVPVAELERIIRLGVSPNTLFDILDSQFELIEQIDEAMAFVKEHKTGLDKDSIIWRFFIMNGLALGKKNYLEAEEFVKQNAYKFRKGHRESDTGRTATWRYVANHGLEGAKNYILSLSSTNP